MGAKDECFRTGKNACTAASDCIAKVDALNPLRLSFRFRERHALQFWLGCILSIGTFLSLLFTETWDDIREFLAFGGGAFLLLYLIIGILGWVHLLWLRRFRTFGWTCFLLCAAFLFFAFGALEHSLWSLAVYTCLFSVYAISLGSYGPFEFFIIGLTVGPLYIAYSLCAYYISYLIDPSW